MKQAPSAPVSGVSGEKRLTPFRIGLLAAVAVLLFLGWREFWFLTDDAHITFRYISNRQRGWGYTWNPPPFLPVEGYSNFLWMVLLDLVWSSTGVEPPAAANVVSLLFSGGTLAVAFTIVWRAPLPAAWERSRFWLALASLVWIVTNRTFLTWTSSGLETALFVFSTTLWAWGALELGRQRRPAWLGVTATGAALSALTRPDGLLLVFATVGLVAFAVARDRLRRPYLLAALPLVSVALHTLWRRAYYGEWVPNTAYAKMTDIWPEAGLRYTASFILEYALWSWIAVAVAAAAIALLAIERGGLPPGRLASRLPAVTVGLTLFAHVAHYTLVIGGDHFEYRAFAHLIVLIGVSFPWLLTALPLRPRSGLILFGLCVGLAQPIPWIHHVRSLRLVTRDDTFKMHVPVADAFPPGPMRRYARSFDVIQKWMMVRHVGTRHREHKLFYELAQRPGFPRRGEGSKTTWETGHPVYELATVGVPAWTMPEVAILDYHGLNDWVIARHAVRENPAERLMAHERSPPAGYIACFDPNVEVQGRKVVVRERKEPLTDERIRACERRYRDWIRH